MKRTVLPYSDDPMVEKKLKAFGLSYKKDEALLSQLDIAGSLENNARLGLPLDDNTVVEYGCGMEDGDPFPRLVTRPPNNGTDLRYILAGNHRTAAAVLFADAKKIPYDQLAVGVYHVTTENTMMCELVARASNRWIGRRTGRDEAVAQAMVMRDKYGMKEGDLAEAFKLQTAWLRNAINAEDYRDTLGDLGINASGITRTSLNKLRQLGPNERIAKRAGHISSRYHLSNTEVKDMVDEVKTRKSEARSMDTLRDCEKRFAKARPDGSTRAKATRRHHHATMFSNIRRLATFLKEGNRGGPFLLLDQMQIVEVDDRRALRDEWREVKRMVDGIFRATNVADATKKRPSTSTRSKKRAKKR